ncbi:leucine-rich colipase-like protein 1 [Glossophaga mutica]
MEGALGAEVALDVGTLLNHLGVDRPAGPMALAGHLLLLLLLLLCRQFTPLRMLHRPTVSSPPPLSTGPLAVHPPWSVTVPEKSPGARRRKAGGTRGGGRQEGPLRFCSCPGSRRTALTSQGLGEPCEEHRECQSGCCTTSSLNPQKYCSSQTVFRKCLSWRRPNGYACSDHTQCRSSCCVTNSYGPLRFCTPRTVFLQCLSWRKPHRDRCSEHSECRSQCCLSRTEDSPARCRPRTGILAQCLLS